MLAISLQIGSLWPVFSGLVQAVGFPPIL